MMLAERKALAVEGTDGEPIRRKSAIVEAARIVASLTSHGVRTLCFAKTRKLQELVLGYARERSSPRLAGAIMALCGALAFGALTAGVLTALIVAAWSRAAFGAGSLGWQARQHPQHIVNAL